MQIGASSWGQPWVPPRYDDRTAGVQKREDTAAGVGGSDTADRGQRSGVPALDARASGAIGRTGDPRTSEGSDATARIGSPKECQTCKSRKYADRSSDPTVSFQTPTSLSSEAAPAAVRAHEQEHVVHEQARARESGRRVVSQNVTIHHAICPECGKSYVAGGTTTTTTKAADEAGSYTSSGGSRGSSAGALVNRLA